MAGFYVVSSCKVLWTQAYTLGTDRLELSFHTYSGVRCSLLWTSKQVFSGKS